jgi:hypothetical protein
LIDPTIAVHNGREIKRTGDGALVEFRSVVDAVRCAIEVQNGMVERNAGVPQDRRIKFRIGIHLGRFDEARAAWQEVFRVNPNYSLEYRRKVLPYSAAAYAAAHPRISRIEVVLMQNCWSPR